MPPSGLRDASSPGSLYRPSHPRIRTFWTKDSVPKDEVHSPAEAESRPQEVQPDRLLNIEERERHEHRQRDHLLEDLQLPQLQLRVADAVGRDLNEILE